MRIACSPRHFPSVVCKYTRCSTLQHAATRCNTLQHAANYARLDSFQLLYVCIYTQTLKHSYTRAHAFTHTHTHTYTHTRTHTHTHTRTHAHTHTKLNTHACRYTGWTTSSAQTDAKKAISTLNAVAIFVTVENSTAESTVSFKSVNDGRPDRR